MISVLCVDDEPGLLNIAKIFLERDEDLKVKTAASAIEGLSAISTDSFDAIVSDYQMPEMDGIEFLKRVRSLDGVPFILFTGRGREDVVIEAINNGVDFYLQKGMEPESQFAELAHKIKHAVHKRRLEEFLVKNEQKFHTFADYTHDWEYWQSEDNSYVYITPSCEQITGYTVHEFNADPRLLSTIIYPDDRDRWIHHTESETQSQVSLPQEIRIIHKNGEIRWISHRCQPIMNAEGKTLGRRSANRDITRQKQDERSIFEAYKQLAAQGELLKQQYGYLRLTDVIQKENNRFLDDIFSSIPDGISILDPDLTILKVNATMERWYAHSMPLVGKKCSETYHLQTGSHKSSPALQTLRTGKATMETVPKIGPDSAIVGWIDLYSFPLIDSQTGTMNGIIEYARDITERRQAEEALRESEVKYRDLVENAGTIIMQTDSEGKITYFNEFAQKFFGFSDLEIIGRSLLGTIMPETESVTGRDLGDIVKDELVHPEKYTHHESEIIKRDGGRYWVAWRNKPQYDEAGLISGIVRYGLDITDRRKTEEALFLANKKLNLLSSITRHDILNQLTVLSGNIELSKKVTQDKNLLEYLNREKQAAKSIQRLISFTGDYQDIGLYRPMWQNLHTIVHLLAKTIDFQSTNLIINLGHLEIYADPLLEKVICTLLENAMLHGGPPKSIRFSFQLVDKGCMILCEDDGTGVAAADKEKIFERGYGKHTGLGLFLSREILGITGFTLHETGNPGKGARFEIIVPKGAFRIMEKTPANEMEQVLL
jgi:PAS domain S-box-containing protein